MAPLKDAYPEVYTVAPSQIKEKKQGQLSDHEIKTFFEEGYLVIKDFFPYDLLERVKTAIALQVDDLAKQLFEAGKVTSLHKEKDFFHRLSAFEAECPGACIIFMKYVRMPPEVEELWTYDKLLNIMEQLVGPEVAGYPIWNLRPKVPGVQATEVPWHQDNAYCDPDAIQTLVPTAWIPLLDANAKNGCMQVVRRGHVAGKTATHICCAGGTWYVELSEDTMSKELGCDLKKDVVTCEVPFGGFLLIQNCIPHRSLPNISDKIRWSLDLRWQDPRKPVGFFGIKDCLPFVSGGKKLSQISWKSFHAKNYKEITEDTPEKVDKKLDTTMGGPWMNRWEIVHHNVHTQRFKETTKASM